jgi:cytochrome P460
MLLAGTGWISASALLCAGVVAPQATPGEPRFTADGQLQRPDDYREWIYLTSGLGMTYGVVVEATANAAAPDFDNVFVSPRAYRAFLETGTWPDKTMLALEVRSSASKGSINKGGHYQAGMTGLEIHVKDVARFPATQWAFVSFGTSARTAKALPANSGCQDCHAKDGAVDQTFVQFYPTLVPVAKAKGTFKASPNK